MVIRIQDVVFRIAGSKVFVYRNGVRVIYSYSELYEDSFLKNVYGNERVIRAFFQHDKVEDCVNQKPILDTSTPIRRGSDGNRYGYGPSDEEAWAYLYLG